MIIKVIGAKWKHDRAGNAELYVRENGRVCIKMRILNKAGTYWLECREMDLYEDDDGKGCYLGNGLKALNASTLGHAKAVAEGIYEKWVEEQIMRYSRILEQRFGRTVWN